MSTEYWTIFDLPGGSWWCSTLATGRRTPSAPSWPSPPLLRISGEIFLDFSFEEFLNYVSARRVAVSMAAPLTGSLRTTHGPGCLSCHSFPSFLAPVCPSHFSIRGHSVPRPLKISLNAAASVQTQGKLQNPFDPLKI